MTMTTQPRRMTKLAMKRASGVDRAANRTQLGPDGVPVDGWMVMKSDGTPVDAPTAKADTVDVPAVDVPVELEFATKAEAMQALEGAAEEIRKSDSGLTHEQALDAAYVRNPAMVAAYRDAEYVAPERVERAAPPELPGSEHIATINNLAREYVERTGATEDKALVAVLKSAEGQALKLQYEIAAGFR